FGFRRRRRRTFSGVGRSRPSRCKFRPSNFRNTDLGELRFPLTKFGRELRILKSKFSKLIDGLSRDVLWNCRLCDWQVYWDLTDVEKVVESLGVSCIGKGVWVNDYESAVWRRRGLWHYDCRQRNDGLSWLLLTW